jgi:hypothetical protein
LRDQILDTGNALVVRSGGQEERIELSDIKDNKYSIYMRLMQLPVVTMSLRRDTVLGNRIFFCAPFSMAPFWEMPPVIEELGDRIEAAHGKQ